MRRIIIFTLLFTIATPIIETTTPNISTKIVASKKSKKYKKIKAFAQAFGRKPVDQIQKYPDTYVTAQDDDGNTIYGWHPDQLPELVRVDSKNNNTDVYLYNKNGKNKMLGKHLYHGRTIYQKQKPTVIYQ